MNLYKKKYTIKYWSVYIDTKNKSKYKTYFHIFLDTVNLFGTSNTCTMMSNSAKKNGRKVAYNDTCKNKIIHIRKIA